MYNIIMTSFNKVKFRYLIQVLEDVMKIENNEKCEKCKCWKNIVVTSPFKHNLLLPMSPLVTILRYPLVPSPVTSFLHDPY